MKCPACQHGDVQLIPAAESGLRVLLREQHLTSYPAAVAACNRCDYAASIVESATRGVVVEEMR